MGEVFWLTNLEVFHREGESVVVATGRSQLHQSSAQKSRGASQGKSGPRDSSALSSTAFQSRPAIGDHMLEQVNLCETIHIPTVTFIVHLLSLLLIRCHSMVHPVSLYLISSLLR